MRLPRPLRTSVFRLTLLYVGLFGVSVSVLFVAVDWTATGYMARQIDETVTSELAELQAEAAADPGPAGLRRTVAELTRDSPGIFYLLQTPDGQVVAGNLPAMAPIPGARTLAPSEDHPRSGLRGRGVLMADGSYVFVALSGGQLEDMQTALARALISGIALTLVVAVAGGLAMSRSVLRRIDAITRASRLIMAGDLDRRVAVAGTDDEFDRLAASLNAMLDRIQALMRGVAEVSTDIAHDLRTPLTRLRQRMELARRREATTEGLHQALDASIRDADGILQTFGALLRIAQIEAGRRRTGFARVDLSELLEGLVETYQPVAEEGGQALTGSIGPGLRVQGDRDLLMQMFANLLENAIGHTPSGSLLRVEARGEGAWAVAVVADNGPGVPESMYDKVTQRFYRLERSRSTPGSGLGLSLVAAVAHLHDTQLELQDNAPGLRCVVRLRAL